MVRGWRGWLALVALGACHHASSQAPDAGIAIDAPGVDAGASDTGVPWTTGPIAIDGSWSEPDWNNPAVPLLAFTGDDGKQARPYSELRLLRDQTRLYVGMYAADEDIEPTDFFQLMVGDLDCRIDPHGHVTASVTGIVAASDVDGTIGSPNDYDEEWVIEAAIPLDAIGRTAEGSALLRGSRCDVTKDGVLHCGSTTASLSLPASATP